MLTSFVFPFVLLCLPPAFHDIDQNNLGEVRGDEIAYYFKIMVSPMSTHAFSYYWPGKETKDQLNFLEFAVCLWTLLATSDLPTYLFCMVDQEFQGKCKTTDLKHAMEIMFHHSIDKEIGLEWKKLIKKSESARVIVGEITHEEFTEWTVSEPK